MRHLLDKSAPDKSAPDKSALDKLANELRSAVLAADHAAADRAARAYAEAVARFWTALTPADRAGSTLPGVARELLGWARGMTIVQRAIAGDQLAGLQRTKVYRHERPVRERANSLEVRA